MTAVLKVFVQMTILVFMGIILRRSRIMDERTTLKMSEILLKAVLPFTIISSSQYPLTDEFSTAIAIVAGYAVVYYFLSLLVIRRITLHTPLSDDDRKIFLTTAVFANTGFLGFPVMKAILPEQGLLLAAIYNLAYNLFFYTYAASLLSGRHKPQSKIEKFRDIVLNPVSLASVAAVVLFLSPFRFPTYVLDTIDLIGGMMVPLSMMILGSTLAAINLRNLFTDFTAYLASFVRVLVLPFIALVAVLVARQFIHIPVSAATTIVIMTALPSGTMNVIYAERYNCSPKFCARIIMITLLITRITLPALTKVCMYFFE